MAGTAGGKAKRRPRPSKGKKAKRSSSHGGAGKRRPRRASSKGKKSRGKK